MRELEFSKPLGGEFDSCTPIIIDAI